jgi:putative transposase
MSREFISKALDAWAHRNSVKLEFSRPGKPTDNAFIESFNGRLRQECLNQNWFLSVADAMSGPVFAISDEVFRCISCH